jgi:hypothetical protein
MYVDLPFWMRFHVRRRIPPSVAIRAGKTMKFFGILGLVLAPFSFLMFCGISMYAAIGHALAGHADSTTLFAICGYLTGKIVGVVINILQIVLGKKLERLNPRGRRWATILCVIDVVYVFSYAIISIFIPFANPFTLFLVEIFCSEKTTESSGEYLLAVTLGTVCSILFYGFVSCYLLIALHRRRKFSTFLQ